MSKKVEEQKKKRQDHKKEPKEDAFLDTILIKKDVYTKI